jgi:exopolysaccharide production protein ExoZ
MALITQTRRLGNIQALRGIAVLAVVLTHLLSVERKYAGDRLLGDVFNIGLSGVDLFFAISGFVMVYVAWRNAEGWRSSLSFLFARIGRIYPLYWLVSLMVLVVWQIRPDMVFASSTQVSLIRSFALFPDHYPPLLAVGWTLIHEMYFYLIFAGLVFMPMRFRKLGLALWGMLVLGGFLLGTGDHGAVLRLLTHPLSFEFLGGALAALAFSRFDGRGWKATLFFGGLWFAIACLVSINMGLGFWETWPRAASFAPAVSLIVYGVAGAERAGLYFNRFLVWLGDQSYALYLTHVLSLSAAGRVWGVFARDGMVDNIVMLPLLLSLAIFVGEITHRVVEIPLLGAVKRLRRGLF